MREQFNFDNENNLEIRDYYKILLKHKVYLFTIPLLFLFVAYIYTLSIPTKYISNTLIMIDKEDRTQKFFGFETMVDEVSLKNEIEILNSRTLAETVIDSLWNSKYKDDLYCLHTKNYQTKLKNIVNKIIGSEVKDKNAPLLLSEQRKISLAKELQRNLTTNLKRDTQTLKLSYSSVDAEESTLILNLIVDIYKSKDKIWKGTEIDRLQAFLEHQLSSRGEELTESENQLKKFQKEANIFNTDGSSNTLLTTLSDYETIQQTSQVTKKVLEEELSFFKNQLSLTEQKLIEDVLNTTNPTIIELRNELAKQEAILIQALNTNNVKNHPVVIEIESKIEYLKNVLTKETNKLLNSGILLNDPISSSIELKKKIIEINAELILLKSRSSEYTILIEKIKSQLSNLPDKTIELARLLRDRQVKENLYLLISEKLEETRISQASQTIQIRTIDPAYPPFYPSSPDMNRNLLLAFIIGLGCSIVISVFLESLNQSISSIDTLQKLGVNILGVIPRIGNGKNNYFRKRKSLYSENNNAKQLIDRLITHLDPQNPVSEAYRNLRTNIIHAKPGEKIKSLLVSSPDPADGKSTSAINIAIAFSQLGYKTLIVDADLRKPVLHKVFDLDRDCGLTELLQSNKNNTAEFIEKTKVENLSCLTSGITVKNPSEILGSQRMSELINSLKENWDFVIFDTPPINIVTDSRVILDSIDAMLTIVRYDKTSMPAFRRTLQLVKSVNAPQIGVIVNDLKDNDNQFGAYYSYYYSSDNES